MSVLDEALSTWRSGAHLDEHRAGLLMKAVVDEHLNPAQVAALLGALGAVGESAEELSGFARSLRARMVVLPVDGPLLDTCGTGGSGLNTFNTSTLSAIVLAAGGVRVAKHGNRASSGKCGSADVLESLGVPVHLNPDACATLLEELGLCFMFAPLYHPALKTVAPTRRELGMRTVFNFLGPLCNPAQARRQVLGVSDPKRAPLIAEALGRLGSERVLVARGSEGLDELSLCGSTRLWKLTDAGVIESEIRPEQLGLETVPFSAIAGGTAEDNQGHFMAVLDGRSKERQMHVALNAGAGFWVAGQADDLKAGVARALEVMASGAHRSLFSRYRVRAAELTR